MTFSTTWYDEERSIIHIEASSTWELQDFYVAVSELESILDSANKTIHVFLDVRDTPALPQGFMSTIRTLRGNLPNTLGSVALIGGGFFTTQLYEVMAHLRTSKKLLFFMANSDDDALEILNKARSHMDMNLQPAT